MKTVIVFVALPMTGCATAGERAALRPYPVDVNIYDRPAAVPIERPALDVQTCEQQAMRERPAPDPEVAAWVTAQKMRSGSYYGAGGGLVAAGELVASLGYQAAHKAFRHPTEAELQEYAAWRADRAEAATRCMEALGYHRPRWEAK